MIEERDGDPTSWTSTAAAQPAAASEPGQVAVLEQALWKRLGESEPLETFAEAWLVLQCMALGSAQAGQVLLGRGDAGRPTARASWPEESPATADLAAVGEFALEEGRGIVHRLETDDRAPGLSVALAYPVVIDGERRGVAAVQLRLPGEREIATAMRRLQWGVAGLRDRLRLEEARALGRTNDLARLALDVLSIVIEKDSYAAASRSAVTELATRLHCERVSLGFVDRGYARVSVVSHSAEFGQRMNLIQQLGAAMDEAIDQHAVVRHPPGPRDDVLVTRAHEELARAHGAGSVLTVPMFVGEGYIGAFTYERPTDAPFDARSVDLLTSVSSLLGPVLDAKRRNDRPLILKAVEAAHAQASHLLGPGHLGRKLVALLLVALTGFAWLATGTDRVTADARIEGRIQRSLIAPFEGFLHEAPVRAGEAVEAGTLLAALDERDLSLARLKWVTERAQSAQRYQRALSERALSEANIARTEIEKADAQIALIDEQLARARIVAPFDGIVVAGDLSQRIGAAVRRGEVLFELAPLDAYRVILDVPESEIADLELEQRGELVTTALPYTRIPIVVTRITPVAEAREGKNRFRVEAELEAQTDRLRPGMEGVAKIEVGERRLVWIWSKSTLDALRLWLWRWIP